MTLVWIPEYSWKYESKEEKKENYYFLSFHNKRITGKWSLEAK